MFQIKVGPTTTDVESALLEEQADAIKRIETAVNEILLTLDGTPPQTGARIVFTIGPVSDKE